MLTHLSLYVRGTQKVLENREDLKGRKSRVRDQIFHHTFQQKCLQDFYPVLSHFCREEFPNVVRVHAEGKRMNMACAVSVRFLCVPSSITSPRCEKVKVSRSRGRLHEIDFLSHAI